MAALEQKVVAAEVDLESNAEVELSVEFSGNVLNSSRSTTRRVSEWTMSPGAFGQWTTIR